MPSRAHRIARGCTDEDVSWRESMDGPASLLTFLLLALTASVVLW
jgi:hypothetical protein